MSEFELAQLFDSYRTLMLELFALFITFCSGYLIASYYIARQLTKLQFTILNIGNVLVAVGTIRSVRGAYGLMNRVQEQLVEMETMLFYGDPGSGNYAIGVMLFMFLASLVFSFSRRKGDTSET